MDGLALATARARWAKFPTRNAPTAKVVEIKVDEEKTNEIAQILARLDAIERAMWEFSHRQSAVAKPAEPAPPRDPTIDDIKKLICREYELTLTELISHSHHRRVTRPRQIAVYLCARLTTHSLPAIARHFAGRDHTTIMAARNKITTERATDSGLDARLAELEAKLKDPQSCPASS